MGSKLSWLCLLFNLFKMATKTSSRKCDVTSQQPGGEGRWNGGGTKIPSKIASNPKPNPQIPQWPLARGGFPFSWRQPTEGLSPLPWRQPTEKGIILTMMSAYRGVSPFRDIRPWRGVSPFHDVSHQRGYCPYHHVQFQLKCKFIPNGTRETVWLPSNNINITVFACWQIFIEAMFSCSQNFRHHFTWYHCLRKFPIVFHSIIIQNYDV